MKYIISPKGNVLQRCDLCGVGKEPLSLRKYKVPVGFAGTFVDTRIKPSPRSRICGTGEEGKRVLFPKFKTLENVCLPCVMEQERIKALPKIKKEKRGEETFLLNIHSGDMTPRLRKEE